MCGYTKMASNCVTEIVCNFCNTLQHSYFVDLYPLYITMVNRKSVAVIEQIGNVTCQRLNQQYFCMVCLTPSFFDVQYSQVH